MIDYINSKKFLETTKIYDLDFLNSKSKVDHEWCMDYKEGTILYNICMQLKPMCILEIGSFHGFSSSYFLQAVEDVGEGFVFTIEIDPTRAILTHDRLCKVGTKFNVINLASVDVEWDQEIDLLFVDGDHSKVKDDLDKFVPYVNSGGLILCHDYHGIHCKNGIDDFFRGKEDKFDITILPDNEFKNDLYIALKKEK